MPRMRDSRPFPRPAPAHRRWRWARENLEAVVAAVAVALLIRTFAAEPYSIPTGSMAPTLLGAHIDLPCPSCGSPLVSSPPLDPEEVGAQATCPNCMIVGLAGGDCSACGRPLAASTGGTPALPEARCSYCMEGISPEALQRGRRRGGDKIIVDKVTYRFRTPRRWEVAVFRRPGQTSMNFVKRVVGLPGEVIDLVGGDVLANDEIVPKPAHLQDESWLPLHSGDSLAAGQGIWEFDEREWSVQDGGLLASRADGRTLALYAPGITDRQEYNALRGGGGEHPVGDFRLRAVVEIESGEALLVLRRNGREIMASLDRNGLARLEVGGDALQVKTAAAGGGVWACQIRDGEISLIVEGKVVIAVPAPWEPEDVASSEAALGVRSGTVRFKRLEIHRDVHYYRPEVGAAESGMSFPFDVPPGEYLMFGDNSPSSKDSRYLGPVPVENFVGRALVVFWPIAPWRLQRVR